MSELEIGKEFELENTEHEKVEATVADDDFGLGEFSTDAVEPAEDALAEFTTTEVEEVEEVGMEVIASCFPDWSLTPEEMFKADEATSKKKQNKND